MSKKPSISQCITIHFKFLYRASENVEEAIECSICLDTLKHDDVVFQLPCKHVFHKDCASTWIYEVRAVCPNCRKGIYDDDEIVCFCGLMVMYRIG